MTSDHAGIAALAEAGLIDKRDPLIVGASDRVTKHGDYRTWRNAIDAMPNVVARAREFNRDIITLDDPDHELDCEKLRTLLKVLHPWRKGPFDLFGVRIDSEWRCDLKWNRVQPHLDGLSGARVLDVGGGNGYYLWRMLGAGAELVLNIDPTPLYQMQFEAVKRFCPEENAYSLPLKSEQYRLGAAAGFDTVFSMGVLYHRRKPRDHIDELKSFLRPGGQLVLETLVVDGDHQRVLVPEKRYAKMRNVWFIPSVSRLEEEIVKAGFAGVCTVDVTVTSVKEQRKTAWMQFQSLSDFLDPGDSTATIEGYPAPRRATLMAFKPD